MKETLISFEIAKFAKEKGFDNCRCDYMYCIGYGELPEDKEIIECGQRNNVKGQFHLALAPTQSLLQKWLREVYQIHIYIIPLSIKNFEYYYFQSEGYTYSKNNGYESYEEALEMALLDGLNMIK